MRHTRDTFGGDDAGDKLDEAREKWADAEIGLPICIYVFIYKVIHVYIFM